MGKFTRLCYGTYNKDTRAEYIKGLPESLKGIEQFMKGHTFVTGNKISYADFNLYYLIVAHLKLDEHFLKPFPNLADFYQAFGSLEGMRRWNASGYSKLPLNNTVAKFR